MVAISPPSPVNSVRKIHPPQFKIFDKCFENSDSFPFRECQALSHVMRIIILLLIMEQYSCLLALQTDGQTDEPALFLESPRYIDSIGIQHSVVV